MTSVLHHRPIVESAPPLAVADATWHSEDDTAAWARRLATRPQLANAYITLHGDLGAGKTTLVRHLLRALGVQGRIKSPTYAVVEPHEAGGLAIWHFDFYRFDDPREWGMPACAISSPHPASSWQNGRKRQRGLPRLRI